MITLQNYINGQLVASVSKTYIDDTDPSKGLVYAQIRDSDEKNVQQAYEAALKAFPAWSNTSKEDRFTILNKIADLIDKKLDELAKAESFGQLMAIFLWIYAFMSPISGIIADRINRKWLIVGSLFTWSSVTLGMGFAQTFDQLYVLRAIMGVSEAFYIPAGLS